MARKSETRFLSRRGPANELLPLNDYAHQIIGKVPHGEIVQAQIYFLRNPKFNALYWALISMVWRNLDHIIFPRVENFHDSLKIMAGIREELWLPPGGEIVTMTGEVFRVGSEVMFYKPGSTAFHAMDEPQFSMFFWFIADLIVQHWMPMAPGALVREVERMTGMTAPSRVIDHQSRHFISG